MWIDRKRRSGMTDFFKRRSFLGLQGTTLLGAASASATQNALSTSPQGAPPPLPQEGQGVFNVISFGAAGTGLVKDTAAIQKAIDACNSARGGFALSS
jgi:hypothetical protein